MIDLSGGADSGETTRYNDSLTLLARGKIRRENSTVFITQTNLQQSRQGNLQLTISGRQGEAGTVACTIDCEEATLPAQVEILVMYCFN